MVSTYNPPLSRAQQWFAALQFVLMLVAISLFLWHADSMAWSTAALWASALMAGVWALGHFMQGRLHALEVLTLQSAALAALSAIGMLELHLLFKPLALVFAIFFVAIRSMNTGATGKFDALLLAALVFSLAGDVFLMLPGNFFIPGLASFLVAHLFYIALLRQGQAWFPNKTALGGVLAAGAVMYAVVLPGLTDPVLQGAVAAYVCVISLMVSQAIGRATTLGQAPARWVALGAGIFMVSDSLIAINRFVAPLPLAPFWILLTYYAAQMLIVHHARPTASGR
jgi:uncharacterized membrane protein YhhN